MTTVTTDTLTSLAPFLASSSRCERRTVRQRRDRNYDDEAHGARMVIVDPLVSRLTRMLLACAESICRPVHLSMKHLFTCRTHAFALRREGISQKEEGL